MDFTQADYDSLQIIKLSMLPFAKNSMLSQSISVTTIKTPAGLSGSHFG